MGQTIENLSRQELKDKAIFNNRFVIEICERVHVHYRNLRITQTLDDFISMAEGFNSALERWKKRGCPGTGQGIHIELARRNVAVVDEHKDIAINLNKNLYEQNEGAIFAEGADFHDEKYIHLKIRDMRIELSVEEFKQLSLQCVEAYGKLNKQTTSSSSVSEFISAT
jgi:hypothetical protein